ncbi:MAG: hypothetical protein VYE22_28725 [Myxococcota bacterium]|nr:hypothetical protein [Myxococcota bacterium]
MRRLCGATISILLLASCGPDLGPADEAAALEIVYTPDGVPAFAGQALMIQSCGAGGFCHSEDIDAQERFGAPLGLDFDVRLASTSNEVELEAADRLLRNQQRVLSMRGHIWEQVQSGEMPPTGEAGRMYAESVNERFERIADDGVTATPLPGLDTEEGRELLRNWLASRTPVIERSQERVDREPNVTGFTIAACERSCVDPTWPAINAQIIQPSCALGRCHDNSDPAGALDLSGSDAEVHARILDAAPEGMQCVGEVPLLTASMPEMSLMYLKVAAASSDDVCGSRMPLSGNLLSEQRLCALRAWIQCGACVEADGGDCADCIAGEREACNVQLGAPGNCMETMPCPNRAALDI